MGHKSIGIDISDHTIEIVQLSGSEKKPKILSLGRIELPQGVVENGRVIDAEMLNEFIDKVASTAQPKPITSGEIIFALPESQVYTHVFSLKDFNKKELNNLIYKEAVSTFPVPKENLVFKQKILLQNNEGVTVLLIGADREVLVEWKEFFDKYKLAVNIFDVETLAIFRSLFPVGVSESVCVVDMGASNTGVGMFNARGLDFSFNLDLSGDDFDRVISEQLQIEEKQAEELKINFGLKDERVVTVLSPVLEDLTEELKINIEYFSNQSGEEIKKIILLGGNSQIPGFLEYFQEKLQIETTLGVSPILPKDFKLEYLEAVGIALLGLSKKHRNEGLFFDKEDMKREEIKIVKKAKKKKTVSKTEEQVITLITILVLGIVLVVGAFWYRANIKKSNQAEKETISLNDYGFTQKYNLDIYLATNKKELTKDRVQARLFSEDVDWSGDVGKVLNGSMLKAKESLGQDEVLWSEPVEGKSTSGTSTLKWLIYNSKDVDARLLEKINRSNVDQFKYLLDGIEYGDISTQGNGVYKIRAEVVISAEGIIKIN